VLSAWPVRSKKSTGPKRLPGAIRRADILSRKVDDERLIAREPDLDEKPAKVARDAHAFFRLTKLETAGEQAPRDWTETDSRPLASARQGTVRRDDG
jgi:hypothetical protein